MTLGNVVHSQSHLGHNVYRFDHCKEYFYISLFQLEVYVPVMIHVISSSGLYMYF